MPNTAIRCLPFLRFREDEPLANTPLTAASPATPAQVVLVGCGAIGLPLAAAFASVGRGVLGVDTDAERVERLSRGRCDPAEAGLLRALNAALDQGTIAFAGEAQPADHARAFIIAVPTPASPAGFDSGPLDAAAAMIGAVARDGDLVCIRSTTPIGTARRLAASAAGRRLRWAASPDRSLAGRAFAEQFEVPHLVGGLDAEAGERAAALFGALAPVVSVPDPETAEAIKLFANVSRDVSFALANQFAAICEAAAIDMSAVRAAGSEGYPRFQVPRPGPVGGPCLPKDVHVLAASAAVAGLDLSLLTAARAVNQGLASRLARDILERMGPGAGPVTILGLAFKGVPATGDQRGGFGGELAQALRAARANLDIRTWDPVAEPRSQAGEAALRGAAVVVLANDHPGLAAALRPPGLAPAALVYDLTGVLAPGALDDGVRVRRFGEGAAVR